MVTYNHNMTDTESDEISGDTTVMEKSVRFTELLDIDAEMEEVD